MVGRPFEKGKSGNPGGKPRAVIEVVQLARQHTPECIQALADIVKGSDSDAARVSAANVLLERGWGKAPQYITIDDQAPDERAADHEFSERLAILARKYLLERRGEPGGILADEMPPKSSDVVH